jgi:hypothetical protein
MSTVVVLIFLRTVLSAVGAVLLVIIGYIVRFITRFTFILLNKATSPETSPFSYFCTLLAIFAAAIGLLKQMLF